MRASIIVAMAVLALSIATTAAEACSRKIPAKAEGTVVPAERIDQNLLDAAVRAEVNFHRCRAGLPALSDAGNGLASVAKGHSVWMASTQTLSHRSTVPGKASLSQRVKASGVKFRTGAENIGMVHRYQIDNMRFRIVNSSACQFATHDGRPLPAHSYASLARHVVDLWMNSPGHRKNILDRNVTRISTAVAFDPKAQYCGRFWLTQNFVG
ncbi:CAP domain-containing protein [Palleronia sp. KMU-117]|uniref:CAP domain-containing protein n=1 Tax=Palleronia sp. KMU-117 TaxID=3434108 RepID=UPI003D74B8D4